MTGLEAYKSLVESSNKLANVGYKYKRNKDYDELIFRDLKILEFIGHHIESVTNENNYYVIMNIAWGNVRGCCEITSVDTRILDVADAEWRIVKPMIKVAHDILELANKVIE